MNLRLSKISYFIVLALVWLLYAIIAINLLLKTDKADLQFGILLCAILTQMSIVIFIKHWYKYGQPFLLDWFRLATFIGIVTNFMTLVPELDNNESIIVQDVLTVKSDIALTALIAVLIALIALRLSEIFVFYSYTLSKVIKKINLRIRPYETFRFKAPFLLFTAIIGLTHLYLVIIGLVGFGINPRETLGSFFGIYQVFTILGPFLLALYAIIVYKCNFKSKLFKACFYLYMIIQIAIGFMSGMKEAIITPFIIVIIPYLLSGRLIPKKFFIIAGLFVVFLYPINNNYRDALYRYPDANSYTAFQIAIFRTFENGFLENFTGGAESYQERFSLFSIFMYSIAIEEEWQEYKYLDRYVFLPVAWIAPRFLVPNKPLSNTGNLLYYKTKGNTGTSITPSTYGWAYLEGGYIPVFFVFALFGFFISLLQKTLNKNDLLGLLMYTITVIGLLKIESDVYFKTTGFLQIYLTGYITYKLFFKTKKRNITHE